jgi:hypothetical protein
MQGPRQDNISKKDFFTWIYICFATSAQKWACKYAVTLTRCISHIGWTHSITGLQYELLDDFNFGKQPIEPSLPVD